MNAHTMKSLFIFTIATVILTACSTFQGEPPATSDATPPAGYAPVFLKRISPMPDVQPPRSAVQIGTVDARTPSAISVFVHIVDSSGTYYSQPDVAKLKKMICKVTTTMDGEQIPVNTFTVRQRTETDPTPFAVAIVIDNSGSMGESRARTVQDAVAAFIPMKKATDAMAIVRYDHRIGIEVPLTTSTSELSQRIGRNGLFGYGGGTAILSGVAEAIQHLSATAAPTMQRAVIVFTDGQENASKISRDALIDLALRERTPIFAVDFGNGVNEGYMEGIARATGGFYQHIYRTSEFHDLFEDVYRRMRNSYVIEFTPATYGKQTVTVQLCWGKDTLSALADFDNTPQPGSIALLDVYFDVGKSVLKPESRRAVQNVVRMMKVYPAMTIELRGHTDSTNNTKDPQFNQKLSQQRAEAVKEALVKAGIAANRITAVGFGDSMPVASNTTEDGRARNRRTEFVVQQR